MAMLHDCRLSLVISFIYFLQIVIGMTQCLKTLLQQGISEPEFYGDFDLEKMWENLTFRSN